MAPLNLTRIRLGDGTAARQLADLRARLSHQGDLVSPRGRELTVKVFGEPLPPARVVERVCADVRARGLAALLHFTEQFDRVRLEASALRVGAADLKAA